MALIKYTGFAHFRELAEHDFEKLGAAGARAISFARHEVVEVSHEVAQAIMENLADEFERVEEVAQKKLPGLFAKQVEVEPAE